jgi:hypothetical protein
MSISVTDITCTSCNNKFHGYFEGIFNVSHRYGATCPKCEKQTLFTGVGAFIDTHIPENAVKITHIVKL